MKTKVMSFNQDNVAVKTMDSTNLQLVKDFKNVGAWIASSDKDIKVRRGIAWSSLHQMKRIWEFDLNCTLKRRLFVSAVE